MKCENKIKLQAYVMRTAAHIIQICDRHKVPYYLIEGSLLGAVRHQGMIPWDDDIDIGVPRTHYQRLVEALKAELPADCCVETYQTRKSHLRYFVQVENTQMQVIENNHIHPQKRFVWVDIFPLDGMPSGSLSRKLHGFGVFFLRLLIQLSQFEDIVDTQKERSICERFLLTFFVKTHIGRNWDTKKLMERLERLLTRYNCDTSEYWINSMTAYKKRAVIPKIWYGMGKKMAFGNYLWNVPDQANDILRYIYGNYMQIPAEEEREKHYLIMDETQEVPHQIKQSI